MAFDVHDLRFMGVSSICILPVRLLGCKLCVGDRVMLYHNVPCSAGWRCIGLQDDMVGIVFWRGRGLF